MTKENLSFRPVRILTLEDIQNDDQTPEEQILLQIEWRDRPLDFGRLVYLERQYAGRKNSNTGHQTWIVNEKTILLHRRVLIRNSLEHIATNGLRPNSVAGYIGKLSAGVQLVERFGMGGDFLRDVETTRDIYQRVVVELMNLVRSSQMKPRTAQNAQQNLLTCIWMAYGRGEYEFLALNNIKFQGLIESVEPREMKEMELAKDTYQAFALQLTDFLVNERSFPYKLKLPGYDTYVFPYRAHHYTPYYKAKTAVYNVEEGRLNTLEEYRKIYPHLTKSAATSNVGSAKTSLALANNDPRCKSRRSLANIALQSFQMFFMIATGAYQEEITRIDFDGDLKAKKSISHKSFKTIKYRSAGKEIQYTIASGAISVLRKYSELRKWVLGGNDYDRMFFYLAAKSWNPKSIEENRLGSFQASSIIGKYLPPDFKPITSRQCRKTKSVFLHSTKIIAGQTISSLLGHSDQTNAGHYSEVSPEVAKSELTNFWNSATEAIFHIKERSKDSKIPLRQIAAGKCDDYLQPNAVVMSPPIIPDCRSQYGCLFCVHFICHADDSEDVHKLLSLLYIVDGVINSAPDQKKVNEKFMLLAARIREIVHAISSKSVSGAENVKQCRKKVYEYEELTPYWENRLQRYERLGLTFN